MGRPTATGAALRARNAGASNEVPAAGKDAASNSRSAQPLSTDTSVCFGLVVFRGVDGSRSSWLGGVGGELLEVGHVGEQAGVGDAS
jgi:hypothetical protein